MNLFLNIDLAIIAGLPLTQLNSGNFQVVENLRETQGILTFFLTQGNSGQF